jgi:hypothetical protein
MTNPHATFQHGTPECDGYVRTFQGSKGDPMIGCTRCRTYLPLNITPDPEPTGYVCRAHYSPVNWRGHGCAQCRQETVTAIVSREMARARARALARDKAEAKARGVSLADFRAERRLASNPTTRRAA